MLHPNQLISICTQLIPCRHDSGSSRASGILLPNSGVNTCPPNFGIKVILFQNYHVCTPDRSVVTVENLDLGPTIYHRSCLLMIPCFKASREHHCFTGAWIHLSRLTINVYPTLARATQQLSYVSLLLASSSALGSARPSVV